MDTGIRSRARNHRLRARTGQLARSSGWLRRSGAREAPSRAGIFRTVVADVYGRQCAVTREKAFPALEAAHIRPFKEEPQHYVRNGLLLRSDVHKLFDAGYVTVTPDYQFEVCDHIHTDFDDGENYYELDGRKLWVPGSAEHPPGREHLDWHNENRFRG